MLKRCDEDPKCMFLMENRKVPGCAKKDKKLFNLNGCKSRRVYGEEPYNKQRYLDTFGYNVCTRDPEKYPPIDYDKFVELADQMCTAQMIADEMGISIGRIYYFSEKNKIKLTRAVPIFKKKKENNDAI